MSHEVPTVEESKEHHVHPFVAWMAVFNFAMIFSLAPSVVLVQAASPSMSSGSEAVAMRLPESSQLAYAKKVAVAADAATTTSTEKKPERTEPSWMRACRITKGDCARNAAGDSVGMHLCFARYHNCVAAGVESSKTKTEQMTEAQADYVEAVKAATEAKFAAYKAADDAFKVAMDKAKADLAAAKAKASASSN